MLFSEIKLKTIVFIGSARNEKIRLADRVYLHLKDFLSDRKKKNKLETITHEVQCFDARKVFSKGGPLDKINETGGAELTSPHCFFQEGKAPPLMNQMSRTLLTADCFVVLACEYNHHPPPGLISMMDYFSRKHFHYKPSGIITYSSGNYGGCRSAMSLIPFLNSLGCIPISKQIHYPYAQKVFDASGQPTDQQNPLLDQLTHFFDELEWWTIAAKRQRENI